MANQKYDLRFEADLGTGFVPFNPPRNWLAIQPQLIFTNDHPSASVQNVALEWTGEEAVALKKYRNGGLSCGLGILEGVPVRIWVGNQMNIKIFDGIIDRSRALWECDIVKAPLRVTGGIDFMNDIAGSFGFKYLASLQSGQPGKITPSIHYKRTPFALADIPNYSQQMIISITLFLTIKELLDVIEKFAAFIALLTGHAATAVAQLGTSAPSLLATITNVVLYLIYLFALVIALVNLVKNLIDNIIQPKKYKLCMREKDLFERGFNYCNLKFVSTIFQSGAPYENATWMPRKMLAFNANNNPTSVFKRPADENQNFPNDPNIHGCYEGTFKDFILDMMQKYNGEFKIIGGTAYFEEKHFWDKKAAFTIPNIGKVGYSHNYPEPSGTNASELAGYYGIFFATDTSDTNTLKRYTGTSVSVTITPKIVKNIQNVLLTNGVSVRLSCALAKRKEHLTRVENLLNGVINALFGFCNFIINTINSVVNVINKVIQFFGGSGATIGTIPLLPTNVVNGRIGWMEISDDSFNVPKTFIGTQVGIDWKISVGSEVIMSANGLLGNLHGKNLATRGNQWTTYEGKEFPFCAKDYLVVKDNNVFKTMDNKFGKMEKVTWNIHDDKAVNVNYRINENFTNNLKETIIVDGE